MTEPRPKVIFWDNLPSPYGVEQYNLLADRGHLDFSVWFSARSEPDRSWNVDESDWRFPGAYIEDPSRRLHAALDLVRRCQRFRPDLLVSMYGERAYVIGHAIVKAQGVRTAFIVLPTFDAWVRRAWWKEAAKLLLFRSAEGAQVPGPDGARYARHYGFPQDRIGVVPMTTNVERFGRGLSADERREHRAQLGVGGCVFLYVGRLWKPKGLMCLIEAFRQARRVNSRLSLLLVGDGVDERDLRSAAADIEGVIFQPFVQPSALYAYYAASDVFVFPTLGDPHGQVIEEAHAARLPIITSDAVGDVHGRVIDGVTGFVVRAGNAGAFTQRMVELAADTTLRHDMGARGAERVKTWGHESYAIEIEAAVREWLSAPRRTTLAARVASAAGQVVIHTAGLAAGSFQKELV